MAAQQGPRSQGALDMLEQTIGEVLIHAGKAIRAQAKNGRKVVGALNATKISDANTQFNSTLDSIETDILRAKATLRRDLDLLRAQKGAAAAAAAAAANPKKESSSSGTPTSLQQAPAAAMDVDLEETKPAAVKIKSEPATDASNANGSTPASNTMAPFPNMDLDSPVVTASPATIGAVSMQVSTSNKSTAPTPQAPSNKSPAVKKETLVRPSQFAGKAGSTPGSTAGTSPAATSTASATAVTAASKAPARKRTVSPAAMRVSSPAASRSTASPAAAKVPSPVLVKSVAGSPAVTKVSTSQPPTPTPAAGVTAGGASKAISLSSSSSSPSVTATSPVLTKKSAAAAAAARSTPPLKSTTPVPAPQIPTPITAPPVKPTLATTAPPVAAPAAPVPAMESSSNDINMDDFFDLTGPSGDDPSNADLRFTNMQFSLVPAGPEEEAKPAQPPPPPQPQPQPTLQAPAQQTPVQTAIPVPQIPTTAPQPSQPSQPPQQQQVDDSDFDVEKFAADAAQNLMMDTDLSTATPSQQQFQLQKQIQLQQQQQQQQQQQSQPPQQNPSDILMPDSGASGADGTGAVDNSDDLFSFINDGMEGLVDDPTTNFDELYMGGGDSIDIDDYFDTA